MPQIRCLSGCVLAAVLLMSCASAPRTASVPEWVLGPETVYPESEYISAVGFGADRASAEAAALSALVKIFRQDVHSETTAVQRYADAVLSESGSSHPYFSESREFAQQVKTSSDIASLIGASIRNVWTASDGTVYALAQMDRRKSASRYASLIQENSEVIYALIASAASRPGTFDGYGELNFAADLARVNADFLDVLSVLDTNVWRVNVPEYGNAAAVEKLARDAASRIVIGIRVENDVDGRVASAFAAVFAGMGFKTSGDPARYELSATLQMQDVTLDSPNKFARFIVTADLRDTETGKVLVPYSVNGREGHLTANEARQRAVRSAERDVQNTFGAAFTAYLDSLLSQ